MEAADIEIGMIITACVKRSPVFDKHAVVIVGCGIFDVVAGLNPRDCRDAIRYSYSYATRCSTCTGGNFDACNINFSIVPISINEICAGFSCCTEGADLDDRTLARLQLNDIESGRLGIENTREIDIGFGLGFSLVQVGNRVIWVSTRNK